ncbi:MAG: AAA family ATPase [Elusimicrobia bacterium]|nr:AAA family ATPase [Elusimicrobiota bacterium]
MSEQISFTWLPFFNEMLTVICNQYNPQTLVPIFKQIFPKQKDEEIQGIKTDFKEIDPLTFIACFNRNETKENRIAFCKTAKEILHLNTPVPADFDGIPAFNNQKTWFLQYSYLRGKGDCTILWNFAKQWVSSHPITEEEMTQILSLKQIGLVKICSFLFICFPTTYYPVDSNSCTFLGLQKEDTFTFFDQLQKVAKEKYPNLKPYELSYRAWQQNNSPEHSPVTTDKNTFWAVNSIWDRHDQIEDFKNQEIWVDGWGNINDKRDALLLSQVQIGDIFVVLSSSTKDTGHNTPFTRIKAVGRVIAKNTWFSFSVKWIKTTFHDIADIAPYRGITICKMKEDPILDYVKGTLTKALNARVFPLNQILYGPPGTGKTYHTIIKALEIINNRTFTEQEKTKEKYDNELLPEFNKLKQQGQIQFLTFHQNYSYEDFMVGIRPDLQNRQISYKLHEGPFKQIADRAKNDPAHNYVMIIDEINRGNISKIFGELITLIEADKRAGNKHALSTPLLYQNEEFSVPNNLYIIGTMNTADKSIALVDIALRRRFVFEEMMLQPNLLKKVGDFNLPSWLKQLNHKITESLDRDHQIGHSYFMEITNTSELKQKFYQCIFPLLKEYFYGNPDKLKEVIPGIDQEKQIEQESDFIRVLQAMYDKPDNKA